MRQIPLFPEENFRKETGYSHYDLFSLTGVFGIHDADSFVNNRQMKLNVAKDKYERLNVEIRTPLISLLRVIKMSEQELYIDYFRLTENAKGKYLGFRRLKSQIDEAKSHGFKKITLLAFGSFEEKEDWDGYIVWGKYGFSMNDKWEIQLFRNKMADDRLVGFDDITDLVVSPLGTALWRHIGQAWHGEFLLDETSLNMQVYTNYGESRSLLG